MDIPVCPLSLEIRQSSIHGLGIFALQDIPAKTSLGLFEGIEYTLKDFKERYGKDTRYCYQLGRQNKIICAKEKRNWITYLNEREPPNCCLQKRGCWTLTDIKQGEELFLWYDKPGVIKYMRDY